MLKTNVLALADTLHMDVIGLESRPTAPEGLLIPPAVKQVWGGLDEQARLAVLYMALKLNQLCRLP